MIKNFDKTLIKPASVNLRLDSIYKVVASKPIRIDERGNISELELPYTLKPGDYIIGKSVEDFEIPPNYAIYHFHRTFTTRLGLEIIGGFGDPGYKGQIYFGIKNVGENTIVLHKDDSLSKVIILPVEGKTIPLISRFLGGKLL